MIHRYLARSPYAAAVLLTCKVHNHANRVALKTNEKFSQPSDDGMEKDTAGRQFTFRGGWTNSNSMFQNPTFSDPRGINHVSGERTRVRGARLNPVQTHRTPRNLREDKFETFLFIS